MLRTKLFFIFFTIASACMAQEYKYDCIFFRNSPVAGNYYYSATNNDGDAQIANIDKKLPVSDNVFHTPGNSLKLQYKNGTSGKWQATIFRKEIRGQDYFKNALFFSFWMLVETEVGSAKELPAIQFVMQDSSLTPPIPVSTTISGKGWQRIILPTTIIQVSEEGKGVFFNKRYPKAVIGVVFSQQSSQEGRQQIIYIDDMEFLASDTAVTVSSMPAINAAKGYAKHIDISWKPIEDKNIHLVKIYRSEDGKKYTGVGVQFPYINRYTDYTGETSKKYYYKVSFVNNSFDETIKSLPVAASTKEMNDDELLSMVQEASFRYYWEAAEKNSGLAKENTHGRQNMIASGASGFGIMALLVGTERKFITRKESVARFLKIVNFLHDAETFHGAYPHFIDGQTKEAEPFFGEKDNGADLVETSFLMQGLLAARQYFSGKDKNEVYIRNTINHIWKRVEWSWFKQHPNSKFLYWHWSPNQGWVINHNLIGWNETMVTYLLAIASPTHPVPASMYYSGWANQDSIGQQYRKGWGQTADGSMYSNGKTYYDVKLDVGVSNGGPLFFTHYSYLGYDPHAITDKYTNYFTNNKNIATINYRYCVENPLHFNGYGDSAWGLTASDGPAGYSADEPVKWQDHAKVTPTGAISSFPYLPAEAMKALKNYYFNYGKVIWGEYGFKDSFSPQMNWCSEIYMGLNQAPMAVMIENYRSGLIWKLFMSSPEVKEGLKKLAAETARQ